MVILLSFYSQRDFFHFFLLLFFYIWLFLLFTLFEGANKQWVLLTRDAQTLRSRGSKTHHFPRGQPLAFCYTSQHKTRKKLRRNHLLYTGWFINLPRFQGARPDHVQVESSCCCFPGKLLSFDPLHVTSFPAIRKRIWVGRYNNKQYLSLDTCVSPFLSSNLIAWLANTKVHAKMYL